MLTALLCTAGHCVLMLQVTGLAVSDRHPYMFSAGLDKMVKCWDMEYNKVGLIHQLVHSCTCNAFDACNNLCTLLLLACIACSPWSTTSYFAIW